MTLENLGFSSWFQEKIDPAKPADHKMARIMSVNKDNYVLKNEQTEIFAEVTGKLLFNAESSLDYPTTGDWVYAQYFDDDTFAIIHDIMPRRTILKRKTSGKKVDFQLIAANIDTAFIIQSLDANYNLNRLERYLVMVNESHIRPVVLLSKSDLLSAEELQEKISGIHRVMPDITIVAFSNMDQSGLEKVRELLIPGETYCLLGSSGVGKTTLLNNLLGDTVFETQEVREQDSRGRHTTTRRQLIVLDNGAMIIDTPGMRELGNMDIESGLDETFDEIAQLTRLCHFNDCTHTQEKGCAVLAALEDGTISEKRYKNYIKMHKESAYYNRSYMEKRRRDKEFGKMYKSIMKDKNKEKR